MMANISGKNTKPEMIVRKGLHASGFRYRLHVKDLPGKPDLVFPKFKSVVFVNGCFWHGHSCHSFQWPKTNAHFWKEKITKNTERDQRNLIRLENEGWKVITIWECALKNRTQKEIDKEVGQLCRALQTK